MAVCAVQNGKVPRAALCIEHGLTMISADSDVARFPELRWVSPLVGR
ncbi:MAG: hypothetical protein S0880_26950 [Actinomycetota bacterium]|nr:hypothetical protein [Actinomycetota bacterium]